MSEDDLLNLIPVTWIKQYYFCPRIIYYLGVSGYDERLTESMIEGKEFHSSEEWKARRRRSVAGERKERVKSAWSKIPAFSKRIGLYGVIDEVYETDYGLVVVENKFMKAPRKPYPSHIYQAVAYAMLAEEKLGRIARKVVIKYLRDNVAFEIQLTEDLKRHVQWATSRIKSIIEGEKLPKGNRKKCRNCGFARICGGV
ncbi:MAG: CRISPR-associated protein Cas4 [Candidatus Parvarchaeota archaeon]|nr:CRISPR-associated protein Cas4 [Candidatus Haiyanarchaeum thermophilum]